MNQITSCGSDTACVSSRRIDVSAAFFFSTEFQQSGFFVYLMNKAAFGANPLYGDYIIGKNLLGAATDADKTNFANTFVTRLDFRSTLDALTNAQYVDRLLANVGFSQKVFTTTLTGSQASPPNPSTATGTSTIVLSSDESTATISLSFSGLSSSEVVANINNRFGAVFPLPQGQVSNFQVGTASFLSDLKAGLASISLVSSNSNPNPEIFGRYASFRQTLVNGLNNGTESRASVLRKVVENSDVQQSQFNAAFVLLEYFGYLRRDPDTGGYNFWLNVLNNTNPPNVRGMVCAFLTSAEYQTRFGDVIRSNAECSGVH